MRYGWVGNGGGGSDTGIILFTIEYAQDCGILDIGDIDEVNAFAGVIGYFLLISHPRPSIGRGGLDQKIALLDSGLEVDIS